MVIKKEILFKAEESDSIDGVLIIPDGVTVIWRYALSRKSLVKKSYFAKYT